MTYPVRPYRYQTHIPIQVTSDGNNQLAHIVDINEAGACVAGLTDVRIGDAVVLHGDDSEKIATVRWATNNRAGVLFDRPIPPKQLNMMRYRSPRMLQTPEVLSNAAY